MQHKFALLIASFICAALSIAAQAFESYPQYRGLQDRESLSLDSPRRLDSEYVSDFITYQMPKAWLQPRLDHDDQTYFALSVGSLGSKDFLVDQQLDVQRRLNETLSFRLIWFHDEDFEERYAGQILELKADLTPRWAVAAFGSVATEKADNDIGVALDWRSTESRSSVRLFYLRPDFQRNQRNNESDRWVKGRQPQSLGIHSEHFTYRFEPRAERSFPDENRKYIYQRQYLRFERQHFAIHWDDKFENNIDTTSGDDDFVRRKRLWTDLNNQFLLKQKWTIEYGIHYFWRQFRSPGRYAELRDILPHATLTSPWNGTTTEHCYSIGIDSNLHSIQWSQDWLDTTTDSYESEFRLNTSWQWKFPNSSELRALLTFDLDSLQSGFWEGGALQFRL